METPQPDPLPNTSGDAGKTQECQSYGGTITNFGLVPGLECTNGPVTAQCLSSRSTNFTQNKQYLAGSQQIHDISGLGSQAYCATSTAGGLPFANFAVLEGWIDLSISTGTCAEGQSLANLLLSKL